MFKSYNLKTNKNLLEIAKNKGIDIPLSIKNILSSCRGVENDIQGDIARQSVISSLKEKDAKTITIYVLIISTLSLIISLIAILNKRY